jgi:hypothetical protein
LSKFPIFFKNKHRGLHSSHDQGESGRKQVEVKVDPGEMRCTVACGKFHGVKVKVEKMANAKTLTKG